MRDLYRLVYASKNLLQGSDAEIAEAVSQILIASQRNNATVDVTGALMFNAGAFAQVLEGPQQGVESTFERIQCDPRHGDVTVLQCGPAERRSFANWSMAFVGQSAPGRARWEGIAAASGFDLSRLDGDAVFAMLHGLVLDEEGLPPMASALPTPAMAAGTLAPVLDVERVRAELPQPGQALQGLQASQGPQASQAQVLEASHEAHAIPAAPAPDGKHTSTNTAGPGLALTVLRSALSQERQRTTDLRNELDDVRIALALQQEQSEVLRQERDVWARRAQLLATVISQEARAVADASEAAKAEADPGSEAGRSGASMKAVA